MLSLIKKIKYPNLTMVIALPLLVLLLGLGITYQFWYLAVTDAKQNLQNGFDNYAKEVEMQIVARLKVYAQVLHSERGFFMASDEVSRNEFKTFIETLHIQNFYPGIQGVGFSLIVPPAEKEKHLAEIRAEGFPNYNIRPEGDREDFYTSIIYLEPFEKRNLRAFGYDMYSEPTRRKAMDKAANNNIVTLSGKVKLVQETEQDVQAGFLMYLPLYRKNADLSTMEKRRANLLAWVYEPLRAKDFIYGIFPDAEKSDLEIEIFDGQNVNEDSALFQPKSHFAQESFLFSTTKAIEFGEHNWTILIHSRPAFEKQLDSERSNFIAGIGVSGNLMLSIIVWLLISGRSRALSLAKKMTDEFIATEKLFQAVFDNAAVGIAQVSLTGRFLKINQEFCHIIGYSQSEVESQEFTFQQITFADDLDADMENVNKLLAGVDNHYSMEKRYIHKDGHIVWVYLAVQLLKNEVGQPLFFISAVQDITKRKEIERALRESEEQFRSYFELALVGFTITSLEKKWVYVNNILCAMLGYSAEELKKLTWAELTHPDDLNADVSQFEQLLAGKIKNYLMDKRFIRKDGSIVYTFLSVSAAYHPDGSVKYTVATVQDITERKQAEQAERQQHALLLNVIDSLSHPFYVINTDDYRVLIANKSAGKWLKGETCCYQLNHKQNFPCLLAEGHPCPVAEVKRTKKPMVVQHQHSDEQGNPRIVEIFAYPIFNEVGEVQQLIEYVIDITDRKQMEQELRDSEAFTNSILNSIPSYIAVIDSEGTVISVNQSWQNFSKESGLPEHKTLSVGDNYFKLFQQTFNHAQITEFTMIQYGITSVLEHHRDSFEVEYPYHSQTQQNWFYLRVTPLIGGRQGVVVSHENITHRKEIEIALRESEERYQSLFEYSPDAYLIMESTDGTIVHCNHAAAEMLRGEPSKIIGLTPDQLSPPHQPDGQISKMAVAKIVEECLRDGKHRFEWIHRRLDGNDFWVEVTIKTTFYQGRTVLLVAWRDISEKKQSELALQRSEERVQIAKRSAGIGIWDYDIPAETLTWDSRMREIWEFSLEKKINYDDFVNSLHPDDRIHVQTALDKALSPDGNGYFRAEYRMIAHYTRREYWIMATGQAFFDKQQAVRMVGIVQDITEQKQLEEALRHAKQAAEQASQFKSEFLANMSHEIRTPMNAILGFSSILNDLITDNTQRYYLDAIHRSGKTLLQLINDILDLSKIEAGKFTLQYSPVSLKTLLEDISVIFSEKAKDKSIEFSMLLDKELPDSLLLDEIRLRQILLNIVGNAFKFTAHGFVRISVSVNFITPNDKLDLIISVYDSGIGIPKDQQEKIFSAFTQQDNQSVIYGGTGLGLTICKRLSDLMKGHLCVESEVGKGSCFTLTLKAIEITDTPLKVDSLSTLPQLKACHFLPAHILVVDDVEINRQLIKSYCKEFSELTLFEAESGKQAMDVLAQQKIDLVLMDRLMPDQNGDEVCQKIRQLPHCKNIPIIMVTASVLKTSTENPIFYDLQLNKPVNKKELLRAMQSFLPQDENAQLTEKTVDVVTKNNTINNNVDSTLLPKLLEILTSDYQERIKQFSDSDVFEIDVFIEIGEELLEIAESYQCGLLADWANTLKNQAKLFDIMNLAKTLIGFETLLKQLRGL